MTQTAEPFDHLQISRQVSAVPKPDSSTSARQTSAALVTVEMGGLLFVLLSTLLHQVPKEHQGGVYEAYQEARKGQSSWKVQLLPAAQNRELLPSGLPSSLSKTFCDEVDCVVGGRCEVAGRSSAPAESQAADRRSGGLHHT